MDLEAELLGDPQGRLVLVMRHHGFTLVELMIGIVILAILTVLALPTFRDFRANTQIRNVADALAQGVRLTQVEAIRRNDNATFETDAATGWTIRDGAGNVVQTENFGIAAGQVVIEPRPVGAVKLTYSPMGLFISPNNPDDGTAVITSFRVTTTTITTPNELRVTTDPALGATRVCEHRFVYPADPAGCPAGLP